MVRGGNLVWSEGTFEVPVGGIVAVIGSNGSGKTSLLNLILGLIPPASGHVRVLGKPPGEVNEFIGYVPQNYASAPGDAIRVCDAVMLGLNGTRWGFGRPSREERCRVAEVLDAVDAGALAGRRLSELSGGQRQRVAMGRAIVRDADVFLFDEPLSNLDAKLRGQMRTEIARLQKRLGITTVYVTHDQTEAMTLGHRVAVLKRGVLQQLATPRELYEQPGNLFVAGFIGSPPMNFLPATVDGDQVQLPFGTVKIPSERARLLADSGHREGVLIAGIRPEYFEDASLVEPAKYGSGSTFDAKVDVVEWLGNETYAYIPFEAPPEVTEQLEQLERDLDGDSMRTQLVINLDGASKVEEGDQAKIWVDSRKIHLFDPATGRNLTLDAAYAGRVPSLTDAPSA